MYSTQFKAIFFYMYAKNNYNSNACPEVASRPGRMIGRRFSTLRPGLEASPEVTDTTPNAPSIDPEPPSD